MPGSAGNAGSARLALAAAAFLTLVLALVPAPEASAADRVALVVGNGAYAHAPPLANPVNDAADMAEALRGFGFEVVLGLDLDREGFYDKLATFADASRGAEAALFFYAGHGLQVDGANYVAPVDVALTSTLALERGAVELETVMRRMRGETNLVFLDACRDNPLAAAGTRGVGRGLARVEDMRRGALIAFATRPGGVAADGDGRNSPFTAALLEHIGRPGESVTDMLTSVTATVLARTAERQEPWVNLSLTRNFYFAPGEAPLAGTVAAPGAPPAPSHGEALIAADRVFWESISGSGDAADFEAYLEAFPSGVYAALARNRLARLGNGGEVSPSSSSGPVPSGAGHAALESGLGLDRAARVALQWGLNVLGFEVGRADGLLGPRSRDAISSWQSAKGYEATSYLTGEQAEALIAAGREARERAERAAAERERAPAVGEVFRDCPHCPEMVVVPAGSFMMGSPSWEEDRQDDEGPRRRVTIGSPFAVGVHEVTFAEWDACVSAGGCGGYRPNDQRRGRGRRPVTNVSWNDAQSYVAWLSRETGEAYRLLSESEWEYVARAGTATRYWWGRDIGRNRANCAGCGSRWDNSSTAPVGSFAANAFGLHDVHGNVWEWVQDCWNGSYAGAPRNGNAWESGGCPRRVLRGGSWDNYPRYLRAADRSWGGTGIRSGDDGFRVAQTFTP